MLECVDVDGLKSIRIPRSMRQDLTRCKPRSICTTARGENKFAFLMIHHDVILKRRNEVGPRGPFLTSTVVDTGQSPHKPLHTAGMKHIHPYMRFAQPNRSPPPVLSVSCIGSPDLPGLRTVRENEVSTHVEFSDINNRAYPRHKYHAVYTINSWHEPRAQKLNHIVTRAAMKKDEKGILRTFSSAGIWRNDYVLLFIGVRVYLFKSFRSYRNLVDVTPRQVYDELILGSCRYSTFHP
ncbi:uncharacterized protein BDR25DRAFT_351420 [Lindgomyces ingoldianus]|uniref:Uncharacterized protein n=1 Tax=Lindgomyces ingoldianus TaxID=673940 RepID=A0ACB6R6R6_9PLEO|nr:uncharacterized protein BDR25DRAFT_351420 [Lindgomyces ingoldianus]KAF2474939.1 hypothetical protein BDR25DRAFT_351420 [Lindgomyces ingoldianus]